MDKKTTQKEKIRLNVFDILIIVAVIACIAAIGVRIYFSTHTKLTNELATVKFEVVGISEENAAEFKSDKKLYLVSGNAEIGQIDNAETKAARLEAIDEDGNITVVSDPIKKTVSGTATLYGVWDGGYFSVNGQIRLSLGSEINVYTDRNRFTLRVLDVTQKNS